jgi:uncharacterized protein (DUF2252 family)
MKKPTKGINVGDRPRDQRAYASADERRAVGRGMREAVPRASHAGWKPAKNRRDPIELLSESNAGRIPQLIPVRFGRMSQSPFAFYRGSAAVMAADLASTPVSGLRVQSCGDAHLMNFGGFATPERNMIFDINDFDETLPAPWEWDVKRLAASVAIAAQHLRLPESDVERIAIDCAREYRERVADYASMRILDVWYDKIDIRTHFDRLNDPAVTAKVRKRFAENLERSQRKSTPEYLFPKLVTIEGTTHRIKDEPPLIFHPTKQHFPGLESGFRDALVAYRESLAENVRMLLDRFRFFDLAIKVVGVGSVGTYCSVALLMAAEDDPLFLQVKQARASVLEPYAGKSLHENSGRRVVVGQRLMQSASDMFLGWFRGKDGRDYYVRQLRDMKMSVVMEYWDSGLLRTYARTCARALARAHARTGDAAIISGYVGTAHTMDEAIGEFAVDYADQNRADYRALLKAIRQGRIKVAIEQ